MFYLKLVVTAFVAMLAWVLLVGTSTMYGWWRQPIAAPADTAGFVQAATQIIEETSRGNVAFLLIEDGEIVAEHYSSYGDRDRVDRDTLFPAASMSKWITAVGAMILVERGQIDLDQPVSAYLTRWQLPDGAFNNDDVTTRRLLSHTSGLTDELGFGDYSAQETLPSLEESLARPRASSGQDTVIALGQPPGEGFQYSGGGYLILQLLIEEVSGQTFATFMEQNVFQPLGMGRSTYAYVGGLANASGSYDASGALTPSFQYAASGATGLVSSAADLARFLQAQIGRGRGESPFAPATITAMRVPHASTMGMDVWGLGTILYAPTRSGDHVFGHDGANDPAINSAARINPDSGDGIVVLQTGHRRLATTLGSHWVYWQTGRPDVLSLGLLLREVAPLMAIGCLAVLVVALGMVWRHRHAPRDNAVRAV